MYSTGQFGNLIKKSVKTLQRWDRDGILSPDLYSPKGHRLYSHKQYLDYFNNNKIIKRKIILYARVSSRAQKNDLIQQIDFIKKFSFNQGKIFDEIYSDIGSGLNYKRKYFLKLIDEITNGLIDEIIIAHKDRLIRFGFELIENLCEKYNTKIIIINDENLSPTEEMTQDLISIIHVFSSRLYGLRKYKNKIKKICKEKNN